MSHVAQIKQMVQESVQEILDFFGLSEKLEAANERIAALEKRVNVLEERALPSVARRPSPSPSTKAQATTATAKGTSEK